MITTVNKTKMMRRSWREGKENKQEEDFEMEEVCAAETK